MAKIKAMAGNRNEKQKRNEINLMRKERYAPISGPVVQIYAEKRGADPWGDNEMESIGLETRQELHQGETEKPPHYENSETIAQT